MSNEHANPNEEPVNESTADAQTALPEADAAAASQKPHADAANMDQAEEAATAAPARVAVELPVDLDVTEAKRALEAVLMAAAEPIPLNELKRIFDGELNADIVRNLLEQLRDDWTGRSVELALVASGYRFRVKPEYQKYLDKLSNEKPPRYSRAVLETLAIIAYRQPVTRGDIEDIRGVAVSPHILKTLQDRGWIDEIGHKEVAGRPTLFATTKHFLDDLNLRSLEELPPLHELQATLDMSQAGAALTAGETPALPGVVAAESGQMDVEAEAEAHVQDQAEAATELAMDAEQAMATAETGESADASLEDASSPVEDAAVSAEGEAFVDGNGDHGDDRVDEMKDQDHGADKGVDEEEGEADRAADDEETRS